MTTYILVYTRTWKSCGRGSIPGDRIVVAILTSSGIPRVGGRICFDTKYASFGMNFNLQHNDDFDN